MRLTPKQKAFCEYYAASGNATEAAIKAGYSEKYAGENAGKLLKNTKICGYIEELAKKKQDARFMAIEERRGLLTQIARDGYEAMTSKGDIDSAARQAAIKAIDTLNKMDGVYIQKQEIKIEATEDFAAMIAASRERVINAERQNAAQANG